MVLIILIVKPDRQLGENVIAEYYDLKVPGQRKQAKIYLFEKG